MREHNGRAQWWILLLVLIGGGAAWLMRYLRDDDGWTEVRTDTWEPEPAEPETVRPSTAARFAADPAPDAPDAPAQPADADAAPADAAPTNPAPDAPADDLTRLEGVGPKIAAALVAAGLTTVAAVAEADESALRAALTTAGLRFAPSLPTWSRQARLLADGDEAGFVALTERLVGGRETS